MLLEAPSWVTLSEDRKKLVIKAPPGTPLDQPFRLKFAARQGGKRLEASFTVTVIRDDAE
jgi:hypothetical protein